MYPQGLLLLIKFGGFFEKGAGEQREYVGLYNCYSTLKTKENNEGDYGNKKP